MLPTLVPSGLRMSIVGKELMPNCLDTAGPSPFSMSIWRLTKRALSTLPTSGWGEDFACEFLAGAAPTGVAIDKDLFAFLGGFGQCVF